MTVPLQLPTFLLPSKVSFSEEPHTTASPVPAKDVLINTYPRILCF